MNPELNYATNEITPGPPPQSFLNRLIGVYFSPGEAFQEIGRAPKMLVPIIAFVLLILIFGYFMTARLPMERMAEQQIEERLQAGTISQEQAEQQREGTRRMMPFFKAVGPILGAIYWVIVVLAVGGMARLVSMVMGAENSFKTLFTVAVYSLLAVTIVSTFLFTILLFVKSAEDFDLNNPLGSNLAALLALFNLSAIPKFLKTLLSYVDIFYIWKIILLGIGFAAVSKKLKTSTAVTLTAVVAFLIALVHASVSALFG